jgi:hypothetical protein
VRGRRFKTQTDIDRHIAHGYGQGDGANYKPWLRVQDVPSQGRSRRVQGVKTGRLHEFLSELEFGYFLVLEFSEQVVDIREQFPLFPTEQAIDIAAQLGIRYPRFHGTQLHYVMSTDFMVTLQAPDGSHKLVARTVKYEEAFQPSPDLKHSVEKLELEKAIWHAQGVDDWKLVTENTLGPTLTTNLIWLRKGKSLERHLQKLDVQLQFLDALEHYARGERALSSMIRAAATATHVPYPDGVLLFKYLVLQKAIRLDIAHQALTLGGPCPALTIHHGTISAVSQLKAA